MSREFPSLAEMCAEPPRVLNLHHGQPNQDSLPAVNIRIAESAANATAEYHDGHFVIVRSAGITDGLEPQDILKLFKEWKRILHRFGLLHLDIPKEQKTHITALLRKTGFSTVGVLAARKDLFNLSGFNGQNEKRIVLFASRKKLPHHIKPKLSEKSFRARCRKFQSTPENPTASFIIPVYNEAASLPAFLRSLEVCANLTNTRREFIFVINGCTDDSESIIRDFIQNSDLSCQLINSEKGVWPAFMAGIAARRLNGFIGELDADVVLDEQVLDLLQIHLTTNPEAMVTYAEPQIRSHSSPYSLLYYPPSTYSRRLFYIGQTCLLRDLPLNRPAIARMLPRLHSIDVFLSQYFVYFYGLDSIAQAPHALTYVKTIDSMEEMVRSVSRLYSEALLVSAAYPPFALLPKVLGHTFFLPGFQRLYDKARNQVKRVEDWTRLESTKG